MDKRDLRGARQWREVDAIADLDQQSPAPLHPRSIGWGGASALAMGGSNQSLFLIGAVLAAQGTAAVPLLAVGLVLSLAALPGWIELGAMYPHRVGGIAATCAEAFRPYSEVLANLSGVCYWWGWVPTCGLTAILSATAVHDWYLPHVPVTQLAVGIVCIFAAVNLCGVKWAARVAVPMALTSATLAVLSAVVPVLTHHVDWRRATSFHLTSPFHGVFGAVTSAMAGLYLVGFAAPAFEAAACHIGEMRNPLRDYKRAMKVSAGMACLYFVALPVVWLGVFGPRPLEGDLAAVLGPTFAPLVGAAGKAFAIWFLTMNMFHGTLQPLSGASRTLSQLSDDGLLPRVTGLRNRYDAPWFAILLTAASAIAFLLLGDPIWLIAAANLTYLIGIALPSVAVWLLRHHEPERARPYRAGKGLIALGVGAAFVWFAATVLGFEQFGLPTVLFGIGLAYSGSILFVWRKWRDRVNLGRPRPYRSMHLKLTTCMLAVLVLDGAGYLVAVGHVDKGQRVLVAMLQDIFVGVALLTIAVGLVLPGIIARATRQVAAAADHLALGVLADFTRAMEALSDGRLDAAHARSDLRPVTMHSKDELGYMAQR
ncbi:MAG TPA: APC family permease, partial [Acidimicrobiales bacterium]|nr:APC family permease [Acidimicrobiales bacterium]